MSIEFRCISCGKLLRVPDGTAGRQASCPACSAVVSIPTREVPSPAPFPSPPSPVEQAPNGPFAPGPFDPFAPAGTEDAGEADNPYRSPSPYSTYAPGPVPSPAYPAGRAYALSRVSGPSTWLIVTAALGLPLRALGMCFTLSTFGAADLGRAQMPFREFALIVDMIGLVAGIVVLVGAIKMKNLESYGLAMTAAIIAMIPWVSPCCLLGLPFGIWAVVVLSEGPVKAAFRR